MSDTNHVKIASLKAKLSSFISKVKKGQQVVVFERDTPVALIIPYPSKTAFKLETVPPQEDPKLLSKIKGIKIGHKKKTSLEVLEDDRYS
jgi:antitoxin (DNA-binding transcriptional repressor) of toxin-antitoxin stability system